MRGRATLAMTAAALLAFGCNDVTTVVQDASEFQTTLSVTSPILEATGDTLVGDTVQFSVTVTRDGNAFRTSEPRFESSDSTVVKILDETTGAASFESTGRATVAVSFSAAQFPDSLLGAAMVVPVDSLAASLSFESAILAAGDTLVGDTVQFNATVHKKDGRAVKTLAQYMSSDTDVVRFIGVGSGLAELVGPGSAQVTVTFLLPLVPGEPLTAVVPIRVTDFALQVSVASLASGAIESGDTLVTDSVQFAVSAQKGGQPITIVDPTFVSSDPSVVQVLDAAAGRAVFRDTGTAVITVDFTQPQLPKLGGALPLRVTTYAVSLSGPQSPVMGDDVAYSAEVIDTGSGEPVASSGREFASTNPSVLEILDSGSGEAFARDLGESELRVTFAEPRLPYGQVQRDLPVSILEERFYGSASRTDGDFGNPVRLSSSAVHSFTPNSWVEFPNGTVGFLDEVTTDHLDFIVPAGAGSGRLRLHNLLDDEGNPRDDVLTHWTFDSKGTVADKFEPNDAFPLSNAVRIKALPWDHLLSADPSKVAPADTNFFWFRLGVTATFDFTAEWQQDADLDFKLCLGKKEPPVDYQLDDKSGQPICTRGPSDNSRDRQKELGRGIRLERGTWILAFYCVDCPTVPLTYRARFVWTGG